MSTFDLDFIVRPNHKYCGLSYGQLAAKWGNWLFSDFRQSGSIYFLRGNVDSEPPIVMTGKNSISICQDIAIFFPIICSFATRANVSDPNDEIDIKGHINRQQTQTTFLSLIVDMINVPNLREYFLASSKFMLEVSDQSIIRQHFDSIAPGKSEALVVGYWILILPFPLGRHNIKFEGWHNDGFKASGHYEINVVNSIEMI